MKKNCIWIIMVEVNNKKTDNCNPQILHMLYLLNLINISVYICLLVSNIFQWICNKLNMRSSTIDLSSRWSSKLLKGLGVITEKPFFLYLRESQSNKSNSWPHLSCKPARLPGVPPLSLAEEQYLEKPIYCNMTHGLAVPSWRLGRHSTSSHRIGCG